MRPIFLVPVFLMFTTFTNAQTAENVALAEQYYLSKEFEKAVANIDLAIQYKKTEKKSKTWYLRGKIYYSLATLSETPSSSSDKIRFNRTATTSFQKARTLDKKGEYEETLNKVFIRMNEVYLNEGLISFNAKDYTNAVFYFELSSETSAATGRVDSLAVFNTALSYEKLNKVDLALENYQKCIDLGYGGAAIYDFMYSMLLINQRFDEAKSILSQGLEMYPNDVSLIRSQLNEYVKDDNGLAALALIDKSIKNKPQSAMLFLMKANLGEKLNSERAQIESDYQKAISLREDYFDANQKMGLFYFNYGMNLLEQSCTVYDPKKAALVEEEGKSDLRKAIPYLEKSQDLKSYDRATLEALKKIYANLEMTKKYDQICLQLNH